MNKTDPESKKFIVACLCCAFLVGVLAVTISIGSKPQPLLIHKHLSAGKGDKPPCNVGCKDNKCV